MPMLMRSWIESANAADGDFPLNNLPCGVFSIDGRAPRCGVAIGDRILDVHALEETGLIGFDDALQTGAWNAFMAKGPKAWAGLRATLTALLREGSDAESAVRGHLVAMAEVLLHMPFAVAEYTDFYAGRHHAFNVGSMFRGPENALPPNWLHIPIGYNGRASSVVVSGTDVRRPYGQLKRPDEAHPRFACSRRFD
ncbi:MAG: fumarylacetoacetase, partial [Rhizobiales bacterium]|nr:fumarylacetoacetase [Hyphomicrobiales bacterium]